MQGGDRKELNICWMVISGCILPVELDKENMKNRELITQTQNLKWNSTYRSVGAPKPVIHQQVQLLLLLLLLH